MKRKRHPNYDPNSANQRILARRTKDRMTDKMIVRRKRFVEGILRGYTRAEAALYAGFSPKTAHRQGSELFLEPYVQELMAEMREMMDEQDIITKKELLVNVKSIAFANSEQGNTRVRASNLLADIGGWKKSRVELTGAEGGPIQSVTIDPSKLSDAALQEILKASEDADKS